MFNSGSTKFNAGSPAPASARDEAINEALYDAVCDGDGRPRADALEHHLAKRGFVIVEASEHSAALLRSQLVESTAATIAELTAERDALANDISMRANSLRLAYDIREALGWNKYTGLSLMPDEVRRLRRIVESTAIAKANESRS